MPKFFDRYVLKEIAAPFFIGLLLCTFVLLMNQILVLSELFIAKGVPFLLVARFLADLVPSLLAFAVPMAVLMGILAGMSRLSTDSEITALRTLGIGTGRLALPVLAFAFAGWLLTSYLTMFLAPRANAEFVRAATHSVIAKFQFKINPREFNESIPKMVIFIQDIDRDRTWRNVFVYLTENPAEPKLILARSGKLHLYPEKKTGTLELRDGTVHSYTLNDPLKYSLAHFERDEETIDVESLFAPMEGQKKVREMDLFELMAGVRTLREDLAKLKAAGSAAIMPETKAPVAKAELPMKKARGQAVQSPAVSAQVLLRDKTRSYRAHWVEIHKKFALPFVCFIFVVIGLPLGVTTRKGGRTSGFTISLVIILLYYILLTAGEKMAMEGRVSPFLGMWFPNILLALAGIYLFIKTLRESSLFSSLVRFTGAGRILPMMERKREISTRRPRLFLKFPNILDRYIGRKYLALFGLIFAGLLLVSLIVTFFERIDNVYDHFKPLSLFMNYLWYRIPEFVTYILPVTGLMATLLVLGLMTKFNEVTAMKACGISIYRQAFPILFLALLTSLFSFYVQDRILPPANKQAEEIWNRINDYPAQSYSPLNRHWMLGREKNRIYHYDQFDGPTSAFSRLSVFDIDLGSWSVARRLYAEKAVLSGTDLDLQKGWSRTFQGAFPGSFEEQKELRLSGVEAKAYFLKEWEEPSQMTYVALRDYVADIEERGLNTTKFKVDLAAKVSFPLACLIMSLIGIPFAFSMGKKGALVGIGLGILIAMVYWGAMGVFQNLGNIGFLPAFLAAWTPNLVFGLVGISLLFRLRT